MNEDQVKGKSLIEQPIDSAKEMDAALRPPSFADFTGQKKKSMIIPVN